MSIDAPAIRRVLSAALLSGVLLVMTSACSAGAGTISPVAGPAAAAAVPADSAEAAAVVERFHRALAAGDSAAVLALLTADALVLEAGGIETRDEYRAGHLAADIAFAQAVPTQRGPIRVMVRGDAAWAVSASTTRGEYQGRAINSAGAELMVLVRTPAGWRIAAVHWSSRTIRS
jgi:ketosteroid isomerase-like protein